MRKILAFFLVTKAFCAVVDSDLDGVPDSLDICPNTPFLQTVNKQGCSPQQLAKRKPKVTVSGGAEYDFFDGKEAKTLFTSLSVKIQNVKLKYFYSVMDYNSPFKSNDSIASLYYHSKFNKVSLKLGAKIYFPTYFNEKTDYAVIAGIGKYYKNLYFSLEEKHKMYTESSTNAKDTLTFAMAKLNSQSIVQPYVYMENSKYDSGDWNLYAGLNYTKMLNKKTFLSGDFSFDTSHIKNCSFTGSVGYTF